MAMSSLGTAYENLGRFEDALFLMKEAYDLRKECFGLNHFLTVRALLSLCRIYVNEGDYVNAITNLNLFIEKATKLYNANDPNVKEASELLEICKK
jgi:tetratricopeptide (TPR) repeat protein